jgi:predicted  nucleic acid-binding Zn-ribbon protein
VEHEEQFLKSISGYIEDLRSKLDERLSVIQDQLKDFQNSRDISLLHRDLYTLADRIDSARVHMYVANEYLKGNGERAFVQDEMQLLSQLQAMPQM